MSMTIKVNTAALARFQERFGEEGQAALQQEADRILSEAKRVIPVLWRRQAPKDTGSFVSAGERRP